MYDLFDSTDTINQLLARYGVKFGIYKHGEYKEQLFPFDPIPRIIKKEEFEELEAGLVQRVTALNLFLSDVYSDKKIVKDGVIPEEFVFSSSGFLENCDGVRPPKNIHNHISGIDLVQSNGTWYILEDNLRVPSGASYPMIARELCRRSSPATFSRHHICDNRNYAAMLKETMDFVNTGGINVILTPGRYNAAYFEHSFLAEQTGSVLCEGKDLTVDGDVVYYNELGGGRRRVGAVYRRISDDFLDPMAFREDSLIGIPNLFEAYKKGNVAILNAPGNGVGDDKGIYYFVPMMIKYYLGEEPKGAVNAPTYLPYYPEDMNYVLAHFDDLVLKDVAEAGGYGITFGSELTRDEKQDFIELMKKEPRRFIAQERLDFMNINVLEGGNLVPRKADLRAFILTAESVRVWKSGLTRFSRDPDSCVVNSSQGGGFKDTWVLSQ